MQPEFIIIHHSAVSRKDNAAQFEAVQRNHIAKGWGAIGYHYFIEPNGKLHEGRRTWEIGAHCSYTGLNIKSIGICLAGNFQIEKPADPQIFRLRDLLKEIAGNYQIKTNKIVGHNETGAPTACPGKNLDMNFVRCLQFR